MSLIQAVREVNQEIRSRTKSHIYLFNIGCLISGVLYPQGIQCEYDMDKRCNAWYERLKETK